MADADPNKGKHLFADTDPEEQLGAQAFLQKLKEFIPKWAESYGTEPSGASNQFKEAQEKIKFTAPKEAEAPEASHQQSPQQSNKKPNEVSFGTPINARDKSTALQDIDSPKPRYAERLGPQIQAGPSFKPPPKSSPLPARPSASEIQSPGLSAYQFGSQDGTPQPRIMSQNSPLSGNYPSNGSGPLPHGAAAHRPDGSLEPVRNPPELTKPLSDHNQGFGPDQRPFHQNQTGSNDPNSQRVAQGVSSRPNLPPLGIDDQSKPRSNNLITNDTPKAQMVESMKVSRMSSPSHARSIVQVESSHVAAKQNFPMMSSFDALPDKKSSRDEGNPVSPRFSVYSNSIRPLRPVEIEKQTVNTVPPRPVSQERSGPKVASPIRPAFKDNYSEFDPPVEASRQEQFEKNQEPPVTIMKMTPTPRVSKSPGLASIKSEHEMENSRSFASRDSIHPDPAGQRVNRKRSIVPLKDEEMSALIREVFFLH